MVLSDVEIKSKTDTYFIHIGMLIRINDGIFATNLNYIRMYVATYLCSNVGIYNVKSSTTYRKAGSHTYKYLRPKPSMV